MTTTTLPPIEPVGAPETEPTRGRARSWRSLLAITLKHRHDPAQAGTIANLRLGAHPATEGPSLRLSDQWLIDLPAHQRPAARRGIALAAKHPGLAASAPDIWTPPGHTLAALHRREHHCAPGAAGANTITGTVDMLALLDLDGAINALDILLGRAAAANLSMDFFSLTRTLLDWGNGISPASLTARSRIVTDFYSATA